MDNVSRNKYINEGAEYFSKNNIKKATTCFLKAVAIDPNSTKANFNLGLCYQALNNPKKALFYFEKATELNPKDYEAFNNLGNLYRVNNQKQKAILSYKRAIIINPKLVEGHNNLGISYQENNENELAIRHYRKVLKIRPNDEEALNNLAVSYQRMGMTQKSIEYYKAALEMNPELFIALVNLGAIYMYSNPDEAHKYLKKACEVNPKSVEARYNLGISLQLLDRLDEAADTFKKVVTKDPNYEQAYGLLYMKYQGFANWKEAEKIKRKMNEITKKALGGKRPPPETPFISVSTYQDPKRNLKIAAAWSEHDRGKVAGIFFKPVYKKKKTKKINIGYLSYDFHDHATMHLIAGLLRNHNKSKFNIFAYSYGPISVGYYRSLAKKYTRFREISQKSDLDAAKIIQKDEIDILVDLKGHTSGCRLGIMVLRPAPVSITWLGFPGTTGSDYVDYLLADKIVLPPKDKKYYSEKVIYLPDTYQPTDNQQKISQVKHGRAYFGIPNDPDVIVFSSFNQAYKIEPTSFKIWMNILKKIPNSYLWLLEGNKKMARNLKKEANKASVNPKRLIFSGQLPKDEHLKRIALSDLALDTFTYNGHTTTSDCLWAGVPVVTLYGKHFASRVSASLLSAVDLTELITKTPKEYQSLVLRLAKDRQALNRIRQKLIINKNQKPLFDTARFTDNLEDVYEQVWEKQTKKGNSKRT